MRIAETTAAKAPSPEAFFSDHVQASVPLVVRGAAAQWPAMEWSAAKLSETFGEEVVTVAPLHTSGSHAFWDKWLEASDTWEHHEPEPAVCDARQLLVVSAMRVKMRMRKFCRLLSDPTAAFYADGAGNLAHSFPFLRGDFSPPPFADALQLRKADLWIGGRSISRMHCTCQASAPLLLVRTSDVCAHGPHARTDDNFDNVFAQVVGSKTFVLSPPHEGARVQGGRRLRKAACRYTHPGQFSRDGGGVLHETVLNYLGVDRPETLPTAHVTLGPGDILYLPFAWWHEVHSHPDEGRGGLCASVSHFYTPYFCRLGGKSCTTLGPLMVNPRHSKGNDEEEESERAQPAEAPTARSTKMLSPVYASAATIALVSLAVGASLLLSGGRARARN